MMKKLTLILALGITTTTNAQRSLEQMWETDTTLATPESVLPDPGKDILYVSLIDGGPWEADGKGGVALLNKKGQILNANWITGLHAPKGMGLYKGKLYVADMSDVAVVNVKKGTVEQRIAVAGAEGLNDITVDSKGFVFVSDSRTGKVHRIRNQKPELYLEGFKGLNGLRAVGTDLYICTANDVFKADVSKKLSTFATMPMGGDGIEPIGNGDFVTSTWSGVVYYITKEGQVSTLLDTREEKKNTADIGYDAKNRIVYVPTFFKKSVVAYRLK